MKDIIWPKREFVREGSRNVDYNHYSFTLQENLKYISRGIAITVLFGWLFYRSILGIFLLTPIIYFYRKKIAVELIKKRKWKINLEFKDAIVALSAALEAGYSSENAFEEAVKDLRQIYEDKSYIIKEFIYIINQIHMNITVEKALGDFAIRTGIDDILSFSEVFSTAKRSGGDLIGIMKTTCNVINGKIDVKKEIVTIISAKRLEANIMKLMPLFILIYLSIAAPGFLNPIYNNLFGAAIMTLVLVCYLGAYLIIDKITDIEV